MSEIELLESHGVDNPIGRYGVPGYHAVADMPRRASIASRAFEVPGWPEFAEIFKFYLGQFVMVSGIAGHGKSTFLFNVLLRLLLRPRIKSFMYVPENEQNLYEILSRIWGQWSNGHARQVFENCMQESVFSLSSNPQSYNDEPKTLHWVLDQACIAVERDRVELVLIDPWNELERAKPRDQLLTDYIGECLMYLKQFTRAMNVITILVAHPTKSGTQGGTMASLAEIEGSMNWFNKCDNGLIVERIGMNGAAKVKSSKVREIGAGRLGECLFAVDDAGVFRPV